MRAFIVLALIAVASAASIAPLHKAKERIPGPLEDIQLDVKFRYSTVVNGFAASLQDKALKLILSLPQVEYVEEDGIARAQAVASWGIDRVNQRNLPLDNVAGHTSGNGANAHAYIIDTGVNPDHSDFGGRATNDYGKEDCNGHGSHCAGTIGSATYGVATGATIHGVQVLGCLGSGSWSEVIDGCDWVANNHIKPAVASLSLGGGSSLTVDRAMTRMSAAGVVVSVAAGNSDADACNYSPARSTDAITVGATDSADIRAYFSNYGSCVDIFAPGVAITSTWQASRTDTDTTNTISGTSMACPHVSGVAALHLSNNPSWSHGEVTSKILADATPNKVTDDMGTPNLLLYAD
ncbi:aqualysin-1-like [Antedon mediterranea]|uniref:aqualysin-1-like n=1 Tax=Antedon mediterranea TaxID=105859 RepID=UPI003AF8B96D